jgi:GTP-binding protein HflX
MILEIFSLRAQTREAKLQIELAELRHKKTTLTHITDAAYSQQRGGTRAVAGAGETQLEVQQRVIADRERVIRKELEDIERRRSVQRSSRYY